MLLVRLLPCGFFAPVKSRIEYGYIPKRNVRGSHVEVVRIAKPALFKSLYFYLAFGMKMRKYLPRQQVFSKQTVFCKGD